MDFPTAHWSSMWPDRLRLVTSLRGPRITRMIAGGFWPQPDSVGASQLSPPFHMKQWRIGTAADCTCSPSILHSTTRYLCVLFCLVSDCTIRNKSTLAVLHLELT